MSPPLFLICIVRFSPKARSSCAIIYIKCKCKLFPDVDTRTCSSDDAANLYSAANYIVNKNTPWRNCSGFGKGHIHESWYDVPFLHLCSDTHPHSSAFSIPATASATCKDSGERWLCARQGFYMISAGRGLFTIKVQHRKHDASGSRGSYPST